MCTNTEMLSLPRKFRRLEETLAILIDSQRSYFLGDKKTAIEKLILAQRVLLEEDTTYETRRSNFKR